MQRLQICGISINIWFPSLHVWMPIDKKAALKAIAEVQASTERTFHLNQIKSKMPFTFQLIVGSKQMHQRKPQQVLVVTCSSNTISGHGSDSHESSCASQLAARAKYLKSHETSCVFKLAALAKCLRAQASCIAFRIMACSTIASISIIKADVSNLLFQIFINIKADLNFIQYSSSILWQMNKMCSTSQMEANEYKFIIKENTTAEIKRLQEDTLMNNSA
jgi:hypothetical protein